MYDMYPWDKAPKAPATPKTSTAAKAPADPAGSAARAVQVALDRRDNGGDSAVAVGAASQTPAGPARQ